MFDSDANALDWYEDHRPQIRVRAGQVIRKYIEFQRALKKSGGNQWVECWQWSDAVSEILDLPQSSRLVSVASQRIQIKAQPWHLERYDDSDMFERLIDQFEAAVDGAGDETARH
jgi:hypothetical protein